MSFGTASLLGSSQKLPGNSGIGGTAADGNIRVYDAATVTGGTSQYGYADERVAASDVTAALVGFSTSLGTQAASFTLAAIRHFSVGQGTFGASSTVTAQTGYNVATSLTGAASNYGFRGQIPAASGRWNLYMDGTAQNYLAGVTGIGVAAAATAALSLPASTTGVAPLIIAQGTAPSAPSDGMVWMTSAGLYYRANGATVGPLT